METEERWQSAQDSPGTVYYQHSLIASPNEKKQQQVWTYVLVLLQQTQCHLSGTINFLSSKSDTIALGSLEPNFPQNSIVKPTLAHHSQNEAVEMCALVEVQTMWFRRTSESLTYSNEKIQGSVAVWGRKRWEMGQWNHSLNEE